LTGIFLEAYTRAMNSATFGALAEPNRLQIVELLRHRPLPVGQIAEQLRMRQPQVSKHLRVLSDAGLVQARPLAQQRIYGLRAEPLRELDSWLERYRRLWDERFEQLDDVLRDLERSKGKTDGHGTYARSEGQGDQ
jgi:DNA-binding transcriptional ArsR family regulator